MFVLGQTYSRRRLHELYGGQQQGGISTPSRHSFIMLFTGEQGHQYGYRDGWTDEGIFLYTGEGQVGDVWHHPDVKDLYMLYLECDSTKGWVNAKWVVGACLDLSDLDCQDWMLP